MSQAPRKVFISYAHEEGDHRDRVLALADSLSMRGLHVALDQYDPNPSQGWPHWMTAHLEDADFVLMVCTPAYYRRVMQKERAGIGLGAQWEGRVIYNLISKDSNAGPRFIPIMLDGVSTENIPLPVTGHTHYRLSAFDFHDPHYDGLYRHLTGQYATPPPKIGAVVHRPQRERSIGSVEGRSGRQVITGAKKSAVKEQTYISHSLRRRLNIAGVTATVVFISAAVGVRHLGSVHHQHHDPASETRNVVNSNPVPPANLPRPVLITTHAVMPTPVTSSNSVPRTRKNAMDDSEEVYISPGYFTMGSDGHDENEKPKHTVYLDDYYIAKMEVSVAQYKKFCDANPGRTMPHAPLWGWNKTEYPMVNVTWDDAQAYSEWAGGSLPTEAQWEKAARGTDGRGYPWNGKWDPVKCCNWTNSGGTPARVGSFSEDASYYGVLDMAGNVWEWCQDWYDNNYYSKTPDRNPPGPDLGDFRVVRGGSWGGTNGADFQCASRGRIEPKYANNHLGFRCVFPVDE